MSLPEILSPAGDIISLRAAVKGGADAVYFGLNELNMRANARNFTVSDLKKVASFCHRNGVKAYLTLNTIVYQDELIKIEKIIKKAKDARIDAIIAWDLSILKICNDKGIRIHLSTQASVSNYVAAKYYHDRFGVKRIVLARECTLKDIKSILRLIKKEDIDLEIEAFIHGAMCVSVSGRCFMSQFVFNRSANRGDCLQPCRRSYIVQDPEEGHELELGNNFVMSPRDLCTLPFFEKLVKAGIDSFKIEGRNRSPEYVMVVTSSYRSLLDYIAKHGLSGLDKKKKELMKELKGVYNRGFSNGFFMGRPIEDWTDNYGSKATRKKKYLGKVLNFYKKVGAVEIKLEAGDLKAGDNIMVQGPTTGVIEFSIDSIEADKKKLQQAFKGMNVAVKSKRLARKNDKVYIIS